MSTLAPIAVIYMGGTFGCVGEPLAPLAAAEFIPLMQQYVRTKMPLIECFTSSPVIKDSSQLNPSDWIELIDQIIQLGAQGYRRVLIIHGTDTLAYTAAFLAHYFATDPIQLVVTGSQFPLLNADATQLNSASDALSNLYLAYQQLTLAANAVQQQGNCWVAFDGEIWPALSVQKIHTTQIPTFTGQHSDPSQPEQWGSTLGQQTQSPLINGLDSNINLTRLNELNIAIYHALPLSAEQQAAQLMHYLSLPTLHAIIMLAFGSGNLSQHILMQQVLQQAAKQHVLVIIASQVPFGGVNTGYAAGHWLAKYGVLSAGHLTVPAVYARLAYILCQPLSFAERQQLWQCALTN